MGSFFRYNLSSISVVLKKKNIIIFDTFINIIKPALSRKLVPSPVQIDIVEALVAQTLDDENLYSEMYIGERLKSIFSDTIITIQQLI